MRARLVRSLLAHVRAWPVHPQWLLSTREESRALRQALGSLRGCVLDVGCAGGRLRRCLGPDTRYIGLDFPGTALGLYDTRPDVFGDARELPIATASVDAVVLKDVLEHVPEPQHALEECARVLRDNGHFVVWMPFMYPVHDAPYDFQRFTRHGLETYLDQAGLDVVALEGQLKPVETAALLGCLAMGDAAQGILDGHRWLIPVLPVLAVAIVVVNLLGKLASLLPAGTFMPAFYRILAKRRSREENDAHG